MEQVGTWCRDNLAGAGVEVNSSGAEGVTVALPYELHSLSSILAALTKAFEVDVDYVTGDNGGELKIYRDHGARLPRDPTAAPAAPASSFYIVMMNLAWAAICIAVLFGRLPPATEVPNATG